ncbi:MAG: hypothetical protein K8E24_013450 [Methanobacterium paludis]|nr:hypothetical protein [Methanobacterium paludis]
MTYADEDAVRAELIRFEKTLTDGIVNRGLARADFKVKSKLQDSQIPSTVPDEIKEAATFYAVAKILDILYTSQDSRSPTAIQNDKDADAILEGYMESNPTASEGATISIISLTGDSCNSSTDRNWW